MPTIRETILSYPGVEDVDCFLDNVVLPNRDMNGSEEYDKTKMAAINLAVADMYSMIGGLPDFKENKLSISYPRSWYEQKAKELYIENGEPQKAAKIGKKITVPRGRVRNSW